MRVPLVFCSLMRRPFLVALQPGSDLDKRLGEFIHGRLPSFPGALVPVVAAAPVANLEDRSPRRVLPSRARASEVGMIPLQVSDPAFPDMVEAPKPVTESIHSPRYAALREALVSARKAAGLTQADVAEALGRPQSFVSKIESGERRLDVVEFLDLVDALRGDPVAILEAVRKVGKRWSRKK